MLSVRNLAGEEELLTDYKTLTCNRKVNGEKMLTLSAFPTKNNIHSYPLIEEESIITFKDEEFVIKKFGSRSIGNTFMKQVDAIHKFFPDMMDKRQRKVHNGSMTFAAACQFVFENSGYTFAIIDTFGAKQFENFGGNNRLSLLQTILERYEAEMEIVGKQVRFKKKIGNDTDFQFRYGFNIKTFSRDIDSSNVSTYIEGKGAEGITASYTSPNVAIFGLRDAEDVEDERFTSTETLLTEIKSQLIDTPEASLTIDFVDLRAAGYPYTVPNEGDRVFTIYEPMDDLEIETRIMEVDEEYRADQSSGEPVPVRTKVTLANYKKSFSGTMFGNIQKKLGEIVNGDGIIKYNVLDEAVRLATEAIKSAQTELDFTNGITGIDKENPNLLTRFTSRGIGVSEDGGNTFPEAITGHGVVTSLLTAGAIHTNNIAIIGDSLFYWDGSGFHCIDPDDLNKYVKITGGHVDIKRGALTLERPDGYVAIQNGLSKADYAITGAIPPYYNRTEIEIAGVFMRTRSTAPVSMEFISFKHESRYLKLRVAMFSENAGVHSTFKVEPVGGGAALLSYNTLNANSQGDEANSGVTLTVDLGVPTGNTMQLYLRMNTGNAGSWAHARIIRFWKEL